MPLLLSARVLERVEHRLVARFASSSTTATRRRRAHCLSLHRLRAPQRDAAQPGAAAQPPHVRCSASIQPSASAAAAQSARRRYLRAASCRSARQPSSASVGARAGVAASRGGSATRRRPGFCACEPHDFGIGMRRSSACASTPALCERPYPPRPYGRERGHARRHTCCALLVSAPSSTSSRPTRGRAEPERGRLGGRGRGRARSGRRSRRPARPSGAGRPRVLRS